MKHQITKYQSSSDERYDFSLLIPTWNNLPFIQNCLQSIEKIQRRKFRSLSLSMKGSMEPMLGLQSRTNMILYIQKKT